MFQVDSNPAVLLSDKNEFFIIPMILQSELFEAEHDFVLFPSSC